MEKLIVGLGNPGKKYEKTRHNIGVQIFSALSFFHELKWSDKFKGLYATYNLKDDKFIFLFPQTFMNLSGESVVPAMQFFKVEKENVLVCHDELDLPFGVLALKSGGGLAGHNGLKSIAGLLGTQDFLRLRLGIGRPSHGNVSAFVLEDFSSDEKIVLNDYFKGAATALETYMSVGFSKCASLYSRKNIVEVSKKEL